VKFAHRGGIKTVLIPKQNVKDLVDIPENIKNHLDIHPVQWIDEVLTFALASQPVPLEDAGGNVIVNEEASEQAKGTTH